MAPGGRGQTENKGSATQEVISPPAFLGAKLTCIKDSYTGINGRRKLSSLSARPNFLVLNSNVNTKLIRKDNE
jgi:hypothetical protein